MARLGSRIIALSLVVSTTLASLPAVAAKEEKVTVVLKSGAKYRGVLVEEVPDDHITIELATGEVKRFAWEDVVHEEEAEAPAEKPKPKEKPKTVEPVDDASTGPTVHIDSSIPGVVLEKRIGQSQIVGGGLKVDHFEFVCRAPCDASISGGEYRLRGDGLRETETFSLSGREPVRIDASLGSRGQHIAGSWLTYGGVALVGVAILGFLIDPKTENCTYSGYPNYDSHCERDHSLEYFNYGMGAVGLISAGIGIALLAGSGNSVRVNGESVGYLPIGKTSLALGPRGLVF